MIYSMVTMRICNFAIGRRFCEIVVEYEKRNEGQDSLEHTYT